MATFKVRRPGPARRRTAVAVAVDVAEPLVAATQLQQPSPQLGREAARVRGDRGDAADARTCDHLLALHKILADAPAAAIPR